MPIYYTYIHIIHIKCELRIINDIRKKSTFHGVLHTDSIYYHVPFCLWCFQLYLYVISCTPRRKIECRNSRVCNRLKRRRRNGSQSLTLLTLYQRQPRGRRENAERKNVECRRTRKMRFNDCKRIRRISWPFVCVLVFTKSHVIMIYIYIYIHIYIHMDT